MNFFERHAPTLQFLGTGLFLGGAIATIGYPKFGGTFMVAYAIGNIITEHITGHRISEVKASK